MERRVLIVEDNRDLADSLGLLLKFKGYNARVTYDGLNGVKVAKEWNPDIVLCDLGLPGLDGFGVAAEVRRNPATANARLVAVTGYGTDRDRERTRQAGFDYHLTKPADPAVLLQLLRHG
jgi:CheY-like chemotaxis protein